MLHQLEGQSLEILTQVFFFFIKPLLLISLRNLNLKWTSHAYMTRKERSQPEWTPQYHMTRRSHPEWTPHDTYDKEESPRKIVNSNMQQVKPCRKRVKKWDCYNFYKTFLSSILKVQERKLGKFSGVEPFVQPSI